MLSHITVQNEDNQHFFVFNAFAYVMALNVNVVGSSFLDGV